MSSATDQTLSRAFELVEANQLEEARNILQPFLAEDPDNADAWWIYAHAVDDAEEARKALNHVMRLDPDYPDAADLLGSLEEKYPKPVTMGIRSLASQRQPGVPTTLPDLPAGPDDPDFLDDWDMEEPAEITEAEKRSERRTGIRRLALPIALVVIVIVIAALLIILRPSGQNVTPTPTSAPQAAAVTSTVPSVSVTEEATPTPETVVTTEEMTPTVEVAAGTPTTEVPSLIPPTEEIAATAETASGDGFGALYAALSGFDVPADGIKMSQTSLGNTLLVTICSTPDAELRTTLSNVMTTIARQSPSAPADAAAVGTHLVNCADGTTLRMIAVKLNDAVAYANGTLSDAQFVSLWKAVG